jgi:hypothetical protein
MIWASARWFDRLREKMELIARRRQFIATKIALFPDSSHGSSQLLTIFAQEVNF